MRPLVGQGTLFRDPPATSARLKKATRAKRIRFDGADYNPHRDDERLTGQLLRVFSLMQDKAWRTLAKIAELTGDPAPSISAQLRHLRKARFGAHTVNRRNMGGGLYEYQVIPKGRL